MSDVFDAVNTEDWNLTLLTYLSLPNHIWWSTTGRINFCSYCRKKKEYKNTTDSLMIAENEQARKKYHSCSFLRLIFSPKKKKRVVKNLLNLKSWKLSCQLKYVGFQWQLGNLISQALSDTSKYNLHLLLWL